MLVAEGFYRDGFHMPWNLGKDAPQNDRSGTAIRRGRFGLAQREAPRANRTTGNLQRIWDSGTNLLGQTA